MTAPILKLRATKTPGEGFPLLGIAPDWFIETVGMRGSDVADAVIAIGGDDALIHLLARAPELAAALAAEKARADAAERMVADLRSNADNLRHEVDILTDGEDNPRRHVTYADGRPVVECEWKRPLRAAADAMRAALASTAEVAGRWYSKEDLSRTVVMAEGIIQQAADHFRVERDAAIAARDEAVARLTRCEMDHVAEVGKVAAAERARDEVGIQLAAAQAEIARMRPVVEAATALRGCALSDGSLRDGLKALRAALRALDAVPGDALAPCASRFVAGCDVFTDEAHKTRAVTTWAARGNGPLWFVEDTATDSMCLVGGESMARRIAALLNGDALAPVARGAPFDEAGTVNPDKLTAALEASGIDSDNVKGVG